VEAENWTGLRFTDLLLMIKRDGKWKVQNKVSTCTLPELSDSSRSVQPP